VSTLNVRNLAHDECVASRFSTSVRAAAADPWLVAAGGVCFCELCRGWVPRVPVAIGAMPIANTAEIPANTDVVVEVLLNMMIPFRVLDDRQHDGK
jgi:hypothetical protein